MDAAVEMFSSIDQISDIPTERLIEICNAWRDGRLIVLPCKAGDTVYKTSYDCAKGIRYNPFNEYGASYAWICLQCDKWPCDIHKAVISVVAKDEDWLLEHRHEFEKTLFITEADAQAALERNERR